MRIKYLFAVLVIALVLPIQLVIADSALMLSGIDVSYPTAIISGNGGSNEWISIRVTKPGITILDAEINQYLYIDAKKCDEDGCFSFSVPIENYYGKFYMEINRKSSRETLKQSFEYIPDSNSSISSFQLGGYKGKIIQNKIEVTVPYGTDITSLVSIFEVSSKAKVYVNGQLQESGKTRNNYSNSVVFTVFAENLTITEYSVIVTIEEKTKVLSGGGSAVTLRTPNVEKELLKPVIEQKKEYYYADLNEAHWAYDAVMTLTQEGVLNGMEDGRFEPDNFVTREQFIKMLVTAFEIPFTEQKHSFEDVYEKDWYYSYVSAATKAGIVTGINNAYFGVGQNITRQDAAVIIHRLMIKKDISAAIVTDIAGFDDSKQLADYAEEAVQALLKSGIINGVGNNLFAPIQNITRAQAASIVYKVYKLI